VEGLFVYLLGSALGLPLLSILATAFSVWLFKRKFMGLAFLCIPFVILPWLLIFPNTVYLNGLFHSFGLLGRNVGTFAIVGWAAIVGGWPIMHFIASQMGDR